jgi:hypothetical protein
VSRRDDVAEHGPDPAVRLKGGGQLPDPVGGDLAVVVGQADDLGARLTDPDITRGRRSPACGLDVAKHVYGSKLHQGDAGRVVFALVDDDDLEAIGIAGENRTNRGHHTVSAITRRYDERNLRHDGSVGGVASSAHAWC